MCRPGHRHSGTYRKEHLMGIGLGIVLLLIGLVLALGAINLPQAVDNVVATGTLGWILIIVGALAIVLALVMNAQRSRSVTRVEDRRVDPRL
ncbi:hypothetical protein GCM10027596_00890 [Nocardioides korecus]